MMENGPFRMVEVDLTDLARGSVPKVVLGPDEGGLAVVIRDEGFVVGFEMKPCKRVGSIEIDPGGLVSNRARNAALASRLRNRFAAPRTPGPSFTVAICTKDRPEGVSRLLASLLPLRADVPFEVLVVDNAPSDDATREVVAAADDVVYVCEPLVGLDFARNRAVREARGDVLAFLDDDVVVDAVWIRGLSQAWSDNPDAGAVTGLVMPLALDTPAQVLFERRGGFRRGFLPARFGSTAFLDPMHPGGAGQFGTGANMSLRLSLLRRIGGFDEALDTGRPLPGGGDLDIFYRVLRAGATLVYEPRAAVFHEHRRDIAGLHRQYRSWGLGLTAFLVKSMRTDPPMRSALRRMILWWFGHQLRRLPARARGREPTPLRMIGAEILGGFQGLLGEYDRSLRRSAIIRTGGG